MPGFDHMSTREAERCENERVSEWNHMREHGSVLNLTMQLAAQTESFGL